MSLPLSTTKTAKSFSLYLTGETFSESFFREGNFLILLPKEFLYEKALRKDRSIFDGKIDPATGVTTNQEKVSFSRRGT